MPEMSCKHNHIGQNTNAMYDPSHSSRNVSHTPTDESAGKPHKCYSYANRRTLQLGLLIDHHIDGNFSRDNQYQEVYNPNIASICLVRI